MNNEVIMPISAPIILSLIPLISKAILISSIITLTSHMQKLTVFGKILKKIIRSTVVCRIFYIEDASSHSNIQNLITSFMEI
jgi:hypothetical protein